MRKTLFLSVIGAAALLAGCGGGGGGSEPPPTPPRANPATVALDEDTQASGTMTGVAGEGGTLSFSVRTQPSNGSLDVAGADYTYTPDADFFGTDSFTFVATESGRSSAPATVTLNVAGVNDAPTSADSNATTDEDTELTGNVSATDVDGDALTLTVETQASNGTVAAGAGTEFTYTPAANYFGTDSFTFTISDGAETTAPATVTIDVAPVNDAPELQSATLNIVAGTVETVDMVGTDIENDTLAYRLTDEFDQATIANDPTNTGLFDVDAAYGTYGADQATVVANDGVDDSAPVTIDITIQVPVTTPNITFDVYDGEFSTFTNAVDEGSDGTIYVTGSVNGEIADPSPDTQVRTFVATHDETGVRSRVVYFDNTRIANLATGFGGGLFTAAGTDVNNNLAVRVLSLDASGDPDTDATANAPYNGSRSFQNLELVHVPGTGFYAISNDNQVHLVNYAGALVSSVSIPAPISDLVHRYDAMDVRVLGNELLVAGGVLTCFDDGSACNGGSGTLGFVMRLDLAGNPLEIIALSGYPRDVAILADGRIAAHIDETLYLLNTDGSIVWQRGISGTTLGLVGLDAAEDIYWWAYDSDDLEMVATRLTADNTLVWQTTSSITVLGTLFPNGLHVDTYGNMFISLNEQYNVGPDGLGRVVNAHADYSGVWQWTEISEPSDMNANGTNPTSKSLLSSSYRLVTIATDDRGNVDQPDGYVFFNAISPAPPAP
ncbi:MAG: Ig-like domain-containing protein [Woeseiaceae bacterium]|nr:Ig-like domain-containing protein [Woeseiaceae bacterium]